MPQTLSIIFFLLLVVAGIRIYWLKKEIKSLNSELKKEQEEFSSLSDYNQKREEIKNRNKEKILQLFDSHAKISSGAVATALGVSSTTAFRYLEELESEKKITQNGKIGKFVFYSKAK